MSYSTFIHLAYLPLTESRTLLKSPGFYLTSMMDSHNSSKSFIGEKYTLLSNILIKMSNGFKPRDQRKPCNRSITSDSFFI